MLKERGLRNRGKERYLGDSDGYMRLLRLTGFSQFNIALQPRNDMYTFGLPGKS